MGKHHVYTQEQIDFIKTAIVGRSYKDVADMFNSHFNQNLTFGQIKGVIARNGFTNGRDCRFHKGQTSFNKGRKGWYAKGTEATRFKKGHTPVNHRPVGSERITVDGYIEIKVKEPRKWRHKHVVIWESKNGPVPKDHVVIFADGDKQNCDIDNLILITRRKLLELNRKGLIFTDADLTKTGLIIADVHIKLYEKMKRKKEV